MPSPAALRLVPPSGAGLNPLAMLQAELVEKDLALMAAQKNEATYRTLAKQWCTVAEVLALRLGGEVVITTEHFARYFGEKRAVTFKGDTDLGELVLRVGEPGSKAPPPPAPAAPERDAAAPVVDAPIEGAV